MEYKKPIVVAEIGCNHMGNIDIAFELIRIAKESGADYAKFQKRNNKELLSESQYNAPHPNPINSYGDTYGEHREKLEFDIDTHKKLKDYKPRDYLLLTGDPAIIGVACSIVSDITHGKFNLLKWDKQERKYYPIEINLHEKGNINE